MWLVMLPQDFFNWDSEIDKHSFQVYGLTQRLTRKADHDILSSASEPISLFKYVYLQH